MTAEYFTVPTDKEPSEEEILAAVNKDFDEFMARWPGVVTEARRAGFVEEEKDNVRFWMRAKVGEPLATANYVSDLKDYASLMSVEEFLEHCEYGGFIDYDGHGSAVKDGKAAPLCIKPSLRHLIPKDATHIEWYNR